MSVHSYMYKWLYKLSLGPGLFFSFVIFFTQTVGLHGWVISPSQGSYLHTGQHKHRLNADTDIHALSAIRTHDPSVRASEDSSVRALDRAATVIGTCYVIISKVYLKR
jgi:hypothetical protein